MAPNSPDLAVFLLTSSDLTDYNVHPFRKFVFSTFVFFSFFDIPAPPPPPPPPGVGQALVQIVNIVAFYFS